MAVTPADQLAQAINRAQAIKTAATEESERIAAERAEAAAKAAAEQQLLTPPKSA